MPDYTEQSGASSDYDEVFAEESIWDGGDSVWDVVGNAVLSNWDLTQDTYTPASGNSGDYTEQ